MPVRPTTDAAKETLFNVLANQYAFEDISFLDLFAGTGNISYEFASRGCSDIVAIDNNYQCTGFIKATAVALQMEGFIVERYDAFKFLEAARRKFDIIFADPPYQTPNSDHLHQLVFENKHLNKGGCLIIEHGNDQDFSKMQHFSDHRSIGSVNFTIFNL